MSVLNKKLKLENKDFSQIYLGEDVLEINVMDKEKIPRKIFDILINRDLLVRIERKRNQSKRIFIDNNFIKKIVEIKNLVSPPKRKILKEVLEHNKVIREKLNTDAKCRRNSKEEFEDFYIGIKRRWEQIENLQRELGLKLLRDDRIGYCTTCFAFRAGKSSLKVKVNLKKKKKNVSTCDSCGKEIKNTKMIKNLPEPIVSYIEGTWFEDYVAEYLKRLGWKIWSQIYIYGNSGVKSEIDILATKDGYNMIVECKTGGVGLKDISTFLTKFYDIKTHIALFISLDKVDQQLKSMIEKNRAIKLIHDIKNDRNLNSKLRFLIK